MVMETCKSIHNGLGDAKSRQVFKNCRPKNYVDSEKYKGVYLSAESLLKPIEVEYYKRLRGNASGTVAISKQEAIQREEEIIRQVKEAVKDKVMLVYNRMRKFGISDNKILAAIFDVYENGKRINDRNVVIQFIAKKLIMEFKNAKKN